MPQKDTLGLSKGVCVFFAFSCWCTQSTDSDECRSPGQCGSLQAELNKIFEQALEGAR